MSNPTFAEVVEGLHGYAPFPWQDELAHRVATSGWPSIIDVPTGLGKTMVIDIALYSLAVQSALPPARRSAQTRVAFIVDRRLVVDSAYRHAAAIRDALERPVSESVHWMADRLTAITGDVPLTVGRMRGGLSWSSRWVARPDQPAVVVGTADQLGSRMLFRGYGTSDRMKPIDAGLLGNDTLVIIDEAHQSSALVETLGRVASLTRRVPSPVLARGLQVVQMTATPPDRASDAPLVGAADEADERAGRRLAAVKRTRIVELTYATSAKKAAAEMADALAGVAAGAIAGASAPVTVGVVANTIDVARRVHQLLTAKPDIAVELVIGRCRPVDREVNEHRWLPSTKVGRDRGAVGRSFVLVATQTIEVGVDLDFDVLVTEAAPIDALVQRLGRLDRTGEIGASDAVIVASPARLAAPFPYGGAVSATWSMLEGHGELVRASKASELATVATDERWIDLGPLRTRELLLDLPDRRALMAPRSQPPVILPSMIDVWRRTSPIPEPDHAVAPFLHGVESQESTVSVGWRVDLNDAALGFAPLRNHELVDVPLRAIRRFVGLQEASDDLADLDGAEQAEEDRQLESQAVRRFAVYRNGGWVLGTRSNDIRPGDVVVVDVAEGGHDEYGWTGEPGVVIDVADLDLDLRRGGSGTSMRLDPRVVGPLFDSGAIGAIAMARAEEPEDVAALVSALRASATRSRYAEPLGALLDAVAHGPRIIWSEVSSETTSPVPVRLLGPRRGVSSTDTADDSTTASSRSVAEVRLGDHLADVGERCAAFAQRLGLDAPLAAAVSLAGRLHDLGKADIRFQALLNGGSEWLAEAADGDPQELLAKSGSRRGGPPPPTRWPKGGRHEAISLRLALAAPDSWFDGLDRDLALHLVASHHGYARPLFPPVVDDSSGAVAVTFADQDLAASPDTAYPAWDHPARFARLCERYGAWGLAMLESVVRLADIAVSEEGR